MGIGIGDLDDSDIDIDRLPYDHIPNVQNISICSFDDAQRDRDFLDEENVNEVDDS